MGITWNEVGVLVRIGKFVLGSSADYWEIASILENVLT
jgi:hypothetical protein